MKQTPPKVLMIKKNINGITECVLRADYRSVVYTEIIIIRRYKCQQNAKETRYLFKR
jgi:hypothetical protein